MATIEIRRAHALPKDDAKKKAEELAKALESKLGLAWRWSGDVITFEAVSGVAKGMTGEVQVAAQDVCVLVDLPLLLRPLKGTVESRVNEKLTQLL